MAESLLVKKLHSKLAQQDDVFDSRLGADFIAIDDFSDNAEAYKNKVWLPLVTNLSSLGNNCYLYLDIH
jgi:hypothetical protein